MSWYKSLCTADRARLASAITLLGPRAVSNMIAVSQRDLFHAIEGGRLPKPLRAYLREKASFLPTEPKPHVVASSGIESGGGEAEAREVQPAA